MKILLLDTEKYKGIGVAENGIIFGKRGKPLTPRIYEGYQQVKAGNQWVSVHRLLALAFIPNPKNYETVNHIDGNKQNNSLNNLEWCSRTENIYHAMDNGLHNWGRNPVIDSDGFVYASQTEAANSIGGVQANISRAIKTNGNYYNKKWRRLNESPVIRY